MRHGKKINHLSRTAAHRKALMANLASSLILHKRINTTVAKAKALRKFIEPLITKAKNDTTHSRRIVFSYLKHKEPVKELFDQIALKVAERPGGYTRIIRTGNRLGDNAETCIIELVDYNELYVKDEKRKSTRRRTRRGPAKKEAATTEKEIVQATTTPEPSGEGSTEENIVSTQTEPAAENQNPQATDEIESPEPEPDTEGENDDNQDNKS